MKPLKWFAVASTFIATSLVGSASAIGRDNTYKDVVYAAGTSGLTYDMEAAYWVDDITAPRILSNTPDSLLQSTGDRPYALSIAVRGGNVYVAGKTLTSDGRTMATVWRNTSVHAQYPGILIGPTGEAYGPNATLPGNSIATGLTINGSDLYVTGGRYWDAQGTTWKSPLTNGSAVTSTNFSGSGRSKAIAVSGLIPAVAVTVGSDGDRAVLWKNGTKHSLTTNSGSSSAKSVRISNGIAYVSGVVFPPGAPGSKAVYWKFNLSTNSVQEIALTNGSNWASALDIAVSGFNTYVVGAQEDTPGIYTSKLWINGAPQSLSDGTLQSEATSVSVSGTNVYVGGYLNASPIVWKNGQPHMYDPNVYGAINSLYVNRELVVPLD